GLSSARALEVDPAVWPDEPDELAALRGKADRVLVDAPCSGIGALRRNPEARWRLAEDDLARLPREQDAILRRAAPLVAPGGRLIHAPSTTLGAETEDGVARFPERAPASTPVSVVEILGGELGRRVSDASGTVLKTLPHRHDTDGFFAAVLRRRQ